MLTTWGNYLLTFAGGIALGCGGGESLATSGDGAQEPSAGVATADLGNGSGPDMLAARGRLGTRRRAEATPADPAPAAPAGSSTPAAPSAGETALVAPSTDPSESPSAGNPSGHCAVPNEAQAEDTSHPDQIVGTGIPASCTGEAFIAAVAHGGIIRFNCGPDPVRITLDRPAKVFNDASDDVVIDGQGKITLDGGGHSRILYMNTCDPAQHWTSAHCDNQETPRLSVQGLTFANASSKDEGEYDGGGAIYVRGGRVKIVSSRFFNNECAEVGSDVGGAAVRVFSQFQGLPVHVAGSTFGGAPGLGNRCSNGGGISSIDVSWSIFNSLFSYNEAIGEGGNPAAEGTPGGGSGGAIYNDGETMTLSVCGTRIEQNEVRAFGSAIFFVSNNHDGTLHIEDSVIRDNAGGDWNVLPGISMHEDTAYSSANSQIE
ncbi:MAG: hypothetical protein ABI895_29645 [Deltaproteobacteria bacterium]